MYAWFVANVWPDENGVPTATIYQWDRTAGKLGEQVGRLAFGSEKSFDQVMAEHRFEVVEGQLSRSVTATGVMIAVRRELAPVYVPARQPAYA